MKSKAARLEIFLARLRNAPRPASADEALALIEHTLNQVEDAQTEIPYDPDRWRNDHRLYAPRPDAARAVQGHPDVTRYRTRGHNVWIGTNGAIRIARAPDRAVVLDLPGADGCRIELD